jgi:hypothetical protein
MKKSRREKIKKEQEELKRIVNYSSKTFADYRSIIAYIYIRKSTNNPKYAN